VVVVVVEVDVTMRRVITSAHLLAMPATAAGATATATTTAAAVVTTTTATTAPTAPTTALWRVVVAAIGLAVGLMQLRLRLPRRRVVPGLTPVRR